MKYQLENLRKFGYDILINRFEPLLREIIINVIILPNHGLNGWKNGIPEGVISSIVIEHDLNIENIDINDFMEETYLSSLKDIIIYSGNYKQIVKFVGNLKKDKFIAKMDELNSLRNKIAHARSNFTELDLDNVINLIKNISQGELGYNIHKYIENEEYHDADQIPSSFFSDYSIPHNLPAEDYDLDGGFVGRRIEMEKISSLLFSEQDRIITITGAGGIGKTAIALKIAYNLLNMEHLVYDAIIWYSAKCEKLTSDRGIIEIEPDIKDFEQLIKDTLQLLNNKTYEIFNEANVEIDKYTKALNNIFSSTKCLLIIDNLETIIDENIFEFIKNIPRPSQVLITSRKGLGEIERRYPLPDFSTKDALILFRIIVKEKNRDDLLRLRDRVITKYLNKVKNYPLLIKWSIGKICLGKDIDEAFSEIESGKSEIAIFSFKDIFNLFSENSKKCLYSMIVYGDKSISKNFLLHISNLDEDNFEDSIKELIISSFIYQEIIGSEEGTVTKYAMLSLTRGFVSNELDTNRKLKNILQSRVYQLSKKIEETERSRGYFFDTLSSLGIRNDDDKVSFVYVKSAKNYEHFGETDKAREAYEKAIAISPTFGYALSEYAKMEFYQKHEDKSNSLFEKAIEFDQENFHIFLAYGSCLRKQRKIDEAILMINRALDLNPEHRAINNELGRLYTIKGEYLLAEDQFDIAENKGMYFDLKHKFFIHQNRADNYKKWARKLEQMGNIDECIKKLEMALDTISKAIELKQGDKRAQIYKISVAKQLAICYCKKGDFLKAEEYFSICFKEVLLRDGSVVNNDREIAESYYFYAYYGNKLNQLSLKKIKESITLGILYSDVDDNLIAKLKRLEHIIDSRLTPSKVSERMLGKIKFFNFYKKYGFIESKEIDYIFFLTSFDIKLTKNDIMNIDGKFVSFNFEESNLKPGRKIAKNILFEGDER